MDEKSAVGRKVELLPGGEWKVIGWEKDKGTALLVKGPLSGVEVLDVKKGVIKGKKFSHVVVKNIEELRELARKNGRML